MNWTEEQIIALSPDAASTKSGKELAKPGKWLLTGKNPEALWGECQGSGKLPYRTQIDLKNTAFKCTCPSRKFPCKHGLGLFLLYVNQANLFEATETPPWVQEWVEKRSEKVQKKAEIKTETAVDVKAQAKRAEARIAKVEAGVEELELWLKDLIRNGLLALPEKSPVFWQNIASRMVDAQAPGLASMLRELGEINYFSENWQSQALERIARIYMVTQGFRRLATLPEALQADIRSMIGWTIKSEELIKTQEGVRDTWLILGRQVEQEQDITVQRNWLYGSRTSRFALVLNFAYKTQTIDTSLVPGTTMEAELVFYPSVLPLRAIVKERYEKGMVAKVTGMDGWQHITQAQAEALALYPWLSQWPVIIHTIVPVLYQNRWVLKDSQNRLAEIDKRFVHIWRLLALSGGYPLDMFGVLENEQMLPLGIWYNNQYITF